MWYGMALWALAWVACITEPPEGKSGTGGLAMDDCWDWLLSAGAERLLRRSEELPEAT